MKYLKNNFYYILAFFSLVSLFIGFIINEDGSGNGASGDFKATYGFIIALQKNLLTNPVDFTLVHTPLHYFMLSFVHYFFDTQEKIRFFFIIFSLLLPITFYKSLEVVYEKKFNKKLILISSIIFLIPAYRYTSIWPTDLITSLIFFQLSTLYFLKWKKKKNIFFNKNIFLQIIFLALATYCRQYFCVFFIFFLFEYFKIIKLIEFIKILFTCFLTSIPVLYYTYLFPELLTSQHMSIKHLPFFLLGNSSMMFVYIFPLLIINFYLREINFNKNNLILLIFSTFFVFTVYLFFENREGWLGGGVVYLFSRKIFNNNFVFLLSSILTYFFFMLVVLENKKNIILTIILIFVFFSFQVYQRYYEPMVFLILFTLYKSKLISNIFDKIKYLLFLYIYYLFYLIGCHLDFLY